MFTNNKYVRGLMMVITVLLIGEVLGKGTKCHRPVIENCDASESFVPGWKFTGWYYDMVMGACRPLYTKNGWYLCTENYNLPFTREACEEICADLCSLINGAPGICMFNEICKTYNKKPRNYTGCGSNSLNCCPKVPDKHLKSLGELKGDRDGIVQIGAIGVTDPAYPPDVFSYIYFLPSSLNKDVKHNY
ncbi:hypothetical protein ACI65C_005677 [Semiaphis heraclei]